MKGNSALGMVKSHIYVHGFRSEHLCRKHSCTKEILDTVLSENPDIVCLNEVMGSIHGDVFRKGFYEAGFRTVLWNYSGHHNSPLDLGTLIATKKSTRELQFELPFGEFRGSGGGSVAIYSPEEKLAVLGVHLGLKKSYQKTQLTHISQFIGQQRGRQRRVVVMGDFNYDDQERLNNEIFSQHSLHPCSAVTFPNNALRSFPFLRKKLDYIWFDSSFTMVESSTLDGPSDHKGLQCVLAETC